MAIIITDDCINCGACEPECPNTAIYEGGIEWKVSDGTSVSGNFELRDKSVIDAEIDQEPVSLDFYFIVLSNAAAKRIVPPTAKTSPNSALASLVAPQNSGFSPCFLQ